jgi:hypothetical protein
MSGRISEKALTSSDLPEPLGPDIRTPPIAGFTAFRIKAFFTVSCPTIAVNGYRLMNPLASPDSDFTVLSLLLPLPFFLLV